MSGFVALFNVDDTPLDPDVQIVWLQKATAALTFRGPDGQASWHGGSIGLGSTLLHTTFDTAPEQQPCTLDGQVWLVGDVRIDDRSGLIARLRAFGCALEENAPDPVLILHAYGVWGEGCLDFLLGDFAFALWDGVRHSLFCARDQVGVVPFFYARVGNVLVVGNTLDVVRSYPGLSSRLNAVAVTDFLLTQHTVDVDSTIYAEIRRLPPSHKLIASQQVVTVTRYWQPPEQVQVIHYRQRQEYVEHFRHLFDAAVRDRLRVDRAASALSGGLDSTSIAVTANRLLREQGAPFDLRGATLVHSSLTEEREGEFAQQVADFAGFPTKRYVAEEYLTRQPAVEVAHPEPEPWTLSALWADPTILQETAQFARVYLMGFGGDPLLSWSRLPWRDALRLGQIRSVARDVRSWLRGHLPTKGRGGQPSQHPMEGLWQMQRGLIAPALATRVDPAARQAHYFAQNYFKDQRRGMFSAPLWETIFRVGDPGYTGQLVKVRFPFFDLRLIDFMMRMPPDPWCLNKYLLREAMVGRLPEEVRLRPKTPLGAFPHFALIAQEGIPAWVHELAQLPALGEFVDRDKLNHILTTPSQLNFASWQMVIVVLTLANWLRQGKHGGKI